MPFNKTLVQPTIFVFLCFSIFVISDLFVFANKNINKEISESDKQALVIRDFCTVKENLTRGKEGCYSKEFRILAEKSGPFVSFEVLHSLQQIDFEAIGCHLMAHSIGKGSYKREPQNWRVLVQNMEPSCNYGAIHGVLEAYVNSLPERSLKRDVIPTICGENPRADCNHIIGHMLLVETDANVKKALDLCEVFKDKLQNEYCLSGVFMEYQTAINIVEHELAPESWMNWPARFGDLEKMCRSYDGKYAVSCWEEIVHVALVSLHNEPQKIFDFCGTAQVLEGVKKCRRHSMGIMGAAMGFDFKKMKSICTIKQIDDIDFEKECYPSLVASALSTVPAMAKEAVSFCNDLDDQFKMPCFSMIGNVGFSNQLVREQLPQVCKKADRDFREYCLGNSSGVVDSSFFKSAND